MSSYTERVVARVAPGQHGLVTRRQLLDAGVPARTIDNHLAAGRLDPLYPTVYRVPGAPNSWRLSVLAATMYAGPESAACGRTAIAMRELLPGHGRVEIVVPMARNPRNRDFVVRRTRKPFRIVFVDGIPTTTVARSLTDVSQSVPPRFLEELIDRALIRHLVTIAELREEGGRVGRLASLRSQAPVESVLEARFLRIVQDGGLPLPVAQLEVRRAGTLIARVDFAYPTQRIAIELESYEFHSSRRALDRGSQRTKDLHAAGYVVVPFTSTDLRRPKQVVSTVRRYLWERGHPDVVNI